MLKTLNKIVHDVTTNRHLADALNVLVKRVRKAMDADVACVYLLDQSQTEHVLIATEGFSKQAESAVRIPFSSGLVGLIARREEPININNSTDHPLFYSHPLILEMHLHAFLGVPIIQHRRLYGVLTVQDSMLRCFDDQEEAFLITLAAQLGGMIAHSEATGALIRLTEAQAVGVYKPNTTPSVLHGIGSSPGAAIGCAVVSYPAADIEAVPRHTVENIEQELELFFNALQATREHMRRLSKRMKSTVSEHESALFDVYLSVLDNNGLGADVAHEIRHEHLSAQSALACVIKRQVLQFESMQDDYLRERASDFRDIGRRVLAQLQSSLKEDIIYPRRVILVGEEVTAAALAEIPEGQLVGVVSAKGSKTSHVAILARAMGVPTVMGVRGLHLEQVSRRSMIVDGYDGHVFISPSKALLVEYKQLIQQEDDLNQSLSELHDKPAQTTDNYRISLQVNTGLAVDAGMSMSVGAEGVGLYRSEVTFMSRDRFPSEDEQCIIYKQTLKAFAPHSVTMRTLDIGGDKCLSYFPIEESNPYLGWRGLRVTLDHPDVFLLQVRAMMRANEGINNLRILLPMVTTLSEVDEAKNLINKAYLEVVEEGCIINKPQIGVMIEVPAAAYQAHEIAKRVDFISVGTNDLTQYILAVDRNNSRVAGLYDSLHPAVLRTLQKILEGGHAAGVKVSVCGEMASDPLAVVLLLAMGFDTLSMNSSSLPRIKWIIRNCSLINARKILAEVLLLEGPREIRLHVRHALEELGLGEFIRSGKN